MKIEGTVNWGIIGCGDVCELKSGPAFNRVPHSKLQAVMRRNGDLAKDFAQRHQVPLFYDDANRLIQDGSVNAIYVATPPCYHEAYTTAALQAGKPVYVEKPVSLDSISVGRMIQEEERNSVPVVVAHYRRELSLFKKVKALVHEGAIGKVNLVLSRTLLPVTTKLITQTSDSWRLIPEISGGGLFHDLSPHQLDIFTWIFGAPIQVTGKSFNQMKHYTAPDTTTLEMEFRNNILFQGLWSFCMPEMISEDRCMIIGDKGSLSFSFFQKPGMKLEWNTSEESRTLEFSMPESIQHPMIAEVVRYFRGEGPNPCSLKEALISMNIIDSTRLDHEK